MIRILISLVLVAFAALNAGCAVTVHPGTLNVGAKATFATNKSRPVCSWNQSDYRSGGTKSHASSQTCTETYTLGDMVCTRTWQQTYQVQNAPGKAYDSQGSSYSSSAPNCRPIPKPEPEKK